MAEIRVSIQYAVSPHISCGQIQILHHQEQSKPSHWRESRSVTSLSPGSESGRTFSCRKLPNSCEMFGVDAAMVLFQILLPPWFPEQQHRTGRTDALSDLDREASSSVCRQEQSVTQTAWALCLAQAVAGTTSSRSKLRTTRINQPLACL